MTDKDALLREAEELRRSAESIKFLDEAVERRSNAGKRQNLVEAIKQVQVKFLNTFEGQVALQGGTLQDVLVKSVNGRLLPDPSSITNFNDHYKGTPNWDTEGERHLTSTECFTRIDLLKKRILEGQLDHLLNTNAETLVHVVMGYNGELLKVLGIDPKQGETYRRITERRQKYLNEGPIELRPEQVQLYRFVGTILGIKIKEYFESKNLGQAPPINPTSSNAEGDVAIGIKIIEFKTRKAAPANPQSPTTVNEDDIAEGVIPRYVRGKVYKTKNSGRSKDEEKNA